LSQCERRVGWRKETPSNYEGNEKKARTKPRHDLFSKGLNPTDAGVLS
jgi:hypothetical protein